MVMSFNFKCPSDEKYEAFYRPRPNLTLHSHTTDYRSQNSYKVNR